ncbi:MAG: 50S ribosome-binding GTPase [Methylococcales bacterium]|nr:50S ribosome-binding GTPase [Methylococcales bacterium]
MNRITDFFKRLESTLRVKIPAEIKNKIEEELNKKLSYEPTIGVFGKTGVGKSSLCNALFGEDLCPISDVQGCTRDPKKVLLSIGGKGLKLLDVPGVGENKERDKEYDELYQNLLPELDLILWVLKGDDRAFSSYEQFYNRLIRPYIEAGKPFLIVINQVDKVEPFREWDVENNRPAGKQAINIEEKHQIVAGIFDRPLGQVITVSANERYHLVELVDAIIHALPNDQKFIVLDKIKHVQEEEIEQAKRATAIAEENAKKAKAEAEDAEERRKAAEKEGEIAMIQAKAEAEIAKARAEAAEADKKRAIAEEEAERERTRRTSTRSEQEADSGFWDTALSVVKSVWGAAKSFFGW